MLIPFFHSFDIWIKVYGKIIISCLPPMVCNEKHTYIHFKFYSDKDLFPMHVNVARLNCRDSDDLPKGKNPDVNQTTLLNRF